MTRVPSPLSSVTVESIVFGLKNKVHGLRFTSGNIHILALFTVRLVPGSDRVLSRRQVWKLKFSVAPSNGVVRVLHHREITSHPCVNIAFHQDELGLVILFRNRRGP